MIEDYGAAMEARVLLSFARQLLIFTAGALLCAGTRVEAQPASGPPPFADLADLALKAPVAAHVRIRDASRIKPAAGRPLPVGTVRFLVTADVIALIRGADGLPTQIRYIVDMATDARGKPPKLKKSEAMLFAAPVRGRNGEVQLIAPDAQLLLTPGLPDRTRAIIAEATSASAPPRITGVGDAFHVAGTLPGQGETQIFLIAEDGRPISISVWREPGEPARWALSLDEIVDQAGGPPARDTLLWYRLACFLPRLLPPASLAGLDDETARRASDDYALVMKDLGTCGRLRKATG